MASIPGPVVAVVEDDASVRVATADLLRSAGIASRSFGSATSFLAEADPNAFACIVTDIQMPGLSGLDLLDELSRLARAPPVILITGKPDDRLRATALARGARALFTKPLDGSALLALIAEIIR